MRLKILALLFLLITSIGGATIPTLETNGAADTLRITDGTSGNPVTWDDVWAFDVGGGLGEVPKDGGGVALVNTFMTEIVKDAVYIISKDIDFGNGATPTYFQSTNEQIYFVDDALPFITANAEFHLGQALGDWSKNGSCMSIGITGGASHTLMGNTNAVFATYGSMIIRRNASNYSNIQMSGGTWIARNLIYIGFGYDYIHLSFGTVDWIDVKLLAIYAFQISLVPDNFSNIHVHSAAYGIWSYQPNSFPNLLITDTSTAEVYFAAVGGGNLELVDPRFNIDGAKITITSAVGNIIEQYTSQIHVADKQGADLEGVDIDVTYAHLVEGSDGKTYKCIEDFTSGEDVFKPIDGSGDWASKWEVYDENGGLGGDWVSGGYDYKADAVELALQTDLQGDFRGANLVTNGDFTDWTTDTPDDWIVTGENAPIIEISEVGADEGHGGEGTGSCNFFTGSDSISIRSTSELIVVDDNYRVTFDVTTSNDGAIKGGTNTGNNDAFEDVSDVGSYSFEWLVVDAEFFEIERNAAEATDITIDNVYVSVADQVIQYKKWVGTSELLEARVHKFTFTKAGYKPLIMEDIIFDQPGDWEVQMPEAVGPFNGAWK